MMSVNLPATLSEVGNYLIVLDDDPGIRFLIKKILKLRVIPFSSARKLSNNAPRFSPRAAFIDIYLGEGELGTDLVPDLRKFWPYTAIFVITSEPSGVFVADALAGGADDFVSKPLDANEVLARFQQRVKEKQETRNIRQVSFGDLKLDFATSELRGPSGTVFLPKLNLELLRVMAESVGTAVEKRILKRRVWGRTTVGDNSVEKRVSEVRSALSTCSNAVSIETNYGRGYRLIVGKS